ncbi:MAG TPA: helix-turn-helix transcriptional regulator, partial [Nitrospiria bacterium]|nr:helix-turn-helix transcriptional regulator [Nitrospiria bacterium]
GFISKRGSDLIENVTWVENPFYRNVIQPLGLKFFLTVACINDRHEHIGLIVLWRSEPRHDFSTRDCFFLEKASAPCASILELTDKSKKDAERPEILRLITQRSYPGVVVLGEKNEIAYINREAKNIMSIFKSGREQLSRSVEEVFLDKLRDIRTKILQKDSGSEQGNGTLPIETFTFRGTTFSCRGIALEGNGGSENLVMILIESVKEEEDGLPVFNNKLSNFTAREGAVARLVSQGFTNKEIASELGIGVHTVKDHIKNIMGKLRTNTRSGIVAKIMVG